MIIEIIKRVIRIITCILMSPFYVADSLIHKKEIKYKSYNKLLLRNLYKDKDWTSPYSFRE